MMGQLGIERLCEPSEEADSYGSPQERLGEHLMVFYWRGKLVLDQPESILVRFFEKASPSVRGAAMRFVGQSVKDTEGDIKAEILGRIIKLWETRLEEAKDAQDTESYTAELKAFGSWFVSAKFDDEWAIKQLLDALQLVQETEPAHLVVERLAVVAEKMPLEAVQCLEHMAKGDHEGWKIHGWIEEAKTILSHAMESGGRAAETAVNLIHYLGSRGHLQFRPLLKSHLGSRGSDP